MIENKLIKVLKKLNPKEFGELGKFIDSPYFSESQINTKFYSFLKNYYPDFDDEKFTKENLCKYLYANEEYNDKKIRDRFTHMLSLVKRYLAHTEYNEEKFDYEKNLLQASLKRGMINIFEDELEGIKTKLLDTKLKDENYYLSKYSLEMVRRKYLDNYIPIGKRDDVYNESSQEIDNAINFFLIVMLKE
jgi:hypothetical protein